MTTEQQKELVGPEVQRAAYQVAEEILKLVSNSAVRPGERLPGERALAERLGCSRNTVREALAALSARGLVEIRMRSGAYLCRQNHLSPDGGRTGPAEALDALVTLGPALVERVCRVAGVSEHEHAERITARLGRALVDRSPLDAWRGLTAFYSALAEITGNSLLCAAMGSIARSGAAGGFENLPELAPAALQQFFAEHVEMLQAMRRHDVALASRCAAGSLDAFGRMLWQKNGGERN
jgi:GntR family transcriptional repressor for pyruvate dehydrogenase complex